MKGLKDKLSILDNTDGLDLNAIQKMLDKQKEELTEMHDSLATRVSTLEDTYVTKEQHDTAVSEL